MRYTVLVAQPARKFLERLTDAGQRARFERIIDGLAVNPRPVGCQPLQDLRGADRVSDEGISGALPNRKRGLLVLVTAIGARGQIYH